MLFQKLALTACVALAATVSVPVFAQSNVDGAIAGKAPGAGSITIEDSATGVKRTVTAAADGSFRAAALPPGIYNVSYTDAAGVTKTTLVSVTIGTTSFSDFSDETIALGEMKITASPVNPIDFQKIESVSIMTEEQLDILPVARNQSAVALLAPGTVKGDTAFGEDSALVSFGGASVAENAYFINGMNVSNFRNGLDPATIPFEAYSQFEVLTGGYSAMYGRSVGGVVNATTKSGTNEFHAGVNIYYEPDFLRANAPDSYFWDNETNLNTAYVYNAKDYYSSLETNIYASGPIWKDKLFFYGIYNIRDVNDRDVIATAGQYDSATNDDPFWLIKVDAIPFENHRLEYTGFQDERTKEVVTSTYDFDIDQTLDDGSRSYDYRGGQTHVGRYTGTFFDSLTISAMYGKSEQDRRTLSETDTEPLILDARTGAVVQLAGNTSPTGLIDSLSLDTREAMRIDASYSFDLAGTHRLNVGYDKEDNTSTAQSAYASPSSTGYWRYLTAAAGTRVNGVLMTEDSEIARFREYANSGNFSVKSNAYYIEDNWSVNDGRLLLRLGLRNEEFENLNANDETFIHVKDQWAPRVGFSYDLFGNRKTKVSVNYGRYHLPIASNTNVRLAGGELYYQEFYYLNSLNSDFTPNVGAEIGDRFYYSNGEVPDTRTIVDRNIKPMYQDEWMLAVQHQLSKSVTVGFRGVYRDLGTVIDDVIVNHALEAWAIRNGYDAETYDPQIWDTTHYILGNPGNDISINWDIDGDGSFEDVLLTKEDLDFPTPVRKYYSVELFAEKVWDGKWTAQFSYTWAHSYGNTEGMVLSDNGQDDAGITILFDTPDLAVNTYGNLPNDVRHHFKLFGSYAVSKDLTVGMNSFLKSGRPVNRLVNQLDSVVGDSYGADYHSIPRGTAGTTDWIFNLDLSLRWKPTNLGAFLSDRVTFQVDVFNVLNLDKATEVYEYAEIDSNLGSVNPRYGIQTSWQTPRYVRFSLGIEY
ncbi:MAG: TonB-dependent receptor plug domain-containing protein [Opitutaceae bacterium]|nr:TonB-dependent receptor plug domain-containing protein [Opitutaceae bacterium]